MSILDDRTFLEHFKNFALYAVARSVLTDAGRHDEKTVAVFSVTFDRQYPLYLECMEYLYTLSEAQRGEVFGQADTRRPHSFSFDEVNREQLEKGGPYAPVDVQIPMSEVFRMWRAEYEVYVETRGEARPDQRSAPRDRPKDLFSVHSSAPVYDIGETIARGEFATPDGGQFPTARIVGGTEGRIEILPFWDHTTNQPLTPQHISLVAASNTHEFTSMQQEALRIATSYNEEMATYFYAMDAYWLMNANNPDDYVQLDISDLLHYSGKRPVKTHGRYTGTFRPDQLQRAGMMVYGMGFSMVEIEKTVIKGVGERSHFKRLWDVSDMYVMQGLDQEKYIESITYRPNEMLRSASFGSRRETALLMSKVLRLDFSKMVVARRLGRYYTWLWRDRAFRGNIDAPIRCEKLLERAGIEVVKGSERFARRRLETALDRLESEGIISQWVLVDEQNQPIDAGERLSFPRWSQLKIAVSPPDVIVSYYANNLTLPPTPAGPEPLDIDKLRETRRRLGLTLAMLSEQTGVDVSTLSRIEAGKTKRPRAEHVEAIRSWLGEAARGAESE